MMKSYDFSKKDYKSLLKLIAFNCRNQIFYDDYIFGSYFDENKVNFNFLKTYDEWNKLGYRIKQGNHAINIGSKYLFDISQVVKVNNDIAEPILTTLNPKYFLDKNSEFYDLVMNFDFEHEYNECLKDNICQFKLDFNTYKSLILYAFYDMEKMFDNAEDLKNRYESYFKKNPDKLDVLYELGDEQFMFSYYYIAIAINNLRNHVYEKVNENKDKYSDLFVENNLIKTLDNSSTMYYYIGRDKNQYIDMEVQNELLNRRNKEIIDDQRNNGSRVIQTNGENAGHERISVGKNAGSIQRNGESTHLGELSYKTGTMDDSRKFDVSSEREIQYEQKDDSRFGRTNDGNKNATHDSAIGRYRQGHELREQIGYDREQIESTIRTNTHISSDNAGKRENKRSAELHKQVSLGQHGREMENVEQVEIPTTISNAQGERVVQEVVGDKEQNAQREWNNGRFSEFLGQQKKDDRNSSRPRIDRELHSLSDLNAVYLELKDVKENEILIDNDERELILNAINYNLEQVNLKNIYYNSFVEKTYNSLNNYDLNESSNRIKLPYKLALDGINGNSVNQNKDSLVNIISFYMGYSRINNNIKEFNLSYSILKKLFLFDYDVKDKIDKNGKINNYSDVNSLILTKDEIDYIDIIKNDNDYLKEYHTAKDDFNFNIFKIDDDNYEINFKDFENFSNRYLNNFDTIIRNYKFYLNNKYDVDINNLSIFDKEYDSFKTFIDIEEKLNNITKENYNNTEIIKPYIDFVELLNVDKDIFSQLKDNNLLSKYANIIIEHYKDNVDELYKNNEVYGILENIYNNEYLTNNDIKNKIKKIIDTKEDYELDLINKKDTVILDNYIDNLVSEETNTDKEEFNIDKIEIDNDVEFYIDVDLSDSEKEQAKEILVENSKENDKNIEKLDDKDVEVISDKEYDYSLITDLDKKYENYDFFKYNVLNDIDIKFDKKLFYQMLEERNDLRKYNKAIERTENRDTNGFSEYVLCHFFGTVGDWYVLDYDKKEDLLYGFVELTGMPDGAEFGWFSLDEVLKTRNYLAPSMVNGQSMSIPCFLDLETHGVSGNKKLCEYYIDKDLINYLGIEIKEKDKKYIEAKSLWRDEEYKKINNELNNTINEDKDNVSEEKDEFTIEDENGIVADYVVNDDTTENTSEDTFVQNSFNFREDGSFGFTSTGRGVSVESDSIEEDEIDEIDKVNEIKELREEIKDNTINNSNVYNYEITDFDFKSIPKSERFNNNCLAIETLQKIENENRSATKEEMDILSKYSGWGGLNNYFQLDKCTLSDFDRIKNLLTEEEYDSCAMSSLDSYYTPLNLINSIYQKLEDMGFKGGDILEPSCAIGNFFGVMPRNMFNNSNITGVELDKISARICSKLYPSVKVFNCGFEDFKNKNKYDLVIGNVPFGESSPYDPIYNKQNFKIHDYFINKSLANLKNGGICAIITSCGTLDKFNKSARESFAKNANFIGGIRLPNGTFNLDGKGTDVNSDILFFIKDEENALKYQQEFINSNSLVSYEDNVYNTDNTFLDKNTNEIVEFERKRFAQLDSDFLIDMFSRQEIIFNDKNDSVIINKKDIIDYNNTSYIYNTNKLNKLIEEYNNWVSNGKHEDEKPQFDNLKDKIIYDRFYDFDNDEFLKDFSPYNVLNVVNHSKNIEFNITDRRSLVNDENIYDKLKDFTINDYFKNNMDQIIGSLETDTNQFGEIIVKNKIDKNTFLSDLKNCLNNIKGVYVKREEVDEKDESIQRIVYFDNELYNEIAQNITQYTYFMYDNQVCFKDFDTAYFIKGSRGNDLKKDVVNRYKDLISIRNCLTNILTLENQGNYEGANKVRVELNNLYDSWIKNNKYTKNEDGAKKGDTIHLNDKLVSSMFVNDRYIYLLQSSENCKVLTDINYTKGKQRNKGSLRLDIDEENDIYEEDLDSILNEIDVEINGENVHLYQLEDEKYYDINGYIYSSRTTEIKLYNENDLKGDVFYKPIILNNTNQLSTDNPKEALTYSLQRKGNVNINYMLDVLNYKYNKEQLVEALKNDIIYDVLSESYILMDDFISHNIKKKINDYKDLLEKSNKELKIVNYDIEHNENNEDIDVLYQKRNNINERINIINENFKILEEHVPVDIPFNAIDISLGNKWVPTDIYTKFMIKEFGINNISYGSVGYNNISDDFYINNIQNVNFNTDETIRINLGLEYNNNKTIVKIYPSQLLLQALSLRPIRLTKYDHTEYDELGKPKDIYITDEEHTKIANSKIKTIRNDFVNFIRNELSEEDKERIVRVYNDKYNLFVKRDWTNKGKDIKFNGISNEIKLHPYQLDVINRAIMQGNTMFAHTVGAGKTFEMIATGMKFKEIGLSNKNLYVVPKNLLPQWKLDFMKLFPNAYILAPNSKDFDVENRKKFLTKIALNNYDAIIISYEQFNKIPLSSSKQQKYIEDDVKHAEEVKNEIIKIADLKNINTKKDIEFKQSIKNIEKFIKAKKDILKRLLDNEKKDKNIVPFDELGIDKIFVDEAHNFKNAYFTTKLGNVKGITPQLTKRTYDMQLKCRYMNEMSNYKGVFLGTGTPVSNSIVELYTMMMYLRPDKLKEMSVNSVDDFISTFSGISTDFEMDNTGTKLQLTSRIKQYNNVPELLNVMNESFDVINKNDLIELSNNRIKLPKVHRFSVVLPETKISKSCQLTLVRRANAIKLKKVKPEKDNMLLLTTDGKKISLYPQLYDENIPYDKINKIEAVVHYATEIYNKYNDRLGTQLIFCDYGLPNSYRKDGSKNFDVYNAIKEKLISNGIKAKEIAFINDWDSPDKKNILSKKVNDGEIRIVIGGTQKLGTGMNVQKRCIAEHHLSIPYRPSDMEQREGRIIRQGNGNPNVYILNYTKQGSFDTRSYSILDNKQKGISQLFDRNSVKNRSINGIEDGDDSINFVDLIACATNDNSLKEIMELEQDIKILEATKSSLKSQLKKNEEDIKVVLPRKIKEEEEFIKIYKTDCDFYNKNKDSFNLKIFGKNIGQTLAEYKSIKEYDDNNGINIFRERMKEIREKQIDQKVLLCEYKGFKIKGEYHAGEDFEIFFQSPTSEHEYFRYKFNDVRLNRLEDWLSKDLPAYTNNHIDKLEQYKAELENKKNAQNMSFDKDEELKEKKERLQVLKQKNAENPDSLIQFDSNGNINEEAIDVDKLEKILQIQAEDLEINESNYKYEDFEFINDEWIDPDIKVDENEDEIEIEEDNIDIIEKKIAVKKNNTKNNTKNEIFIDNENDKK